MFVEIIFYVKQGNKPIGFDYYEKLHGWVCNLVGNDCYGKPINDYTYSNIAGTLFNKNGICLKNGMGYFIIRTGNKTVFDNFLKNYDNVKDKELFYGIKLVNFAINPVSEVKKNRFRTKVESPILVHSKKYESLNSKNWYDDNDLANCEKYLKGSIFKKANAQGIKLDENLSVKILNQKKHSDIIYHKNHNIGRVFDLEINCNAETKEFILVNGIGVSCGNGFGMIE